jgi:hypothetical protein
MKQKFLFFILIPSWPLQAQVLEQILTRNEMAMGDRKQIESIQSFKMISRLEEFGSYVADPFISYFQREHKVAIEAHIKSYGIYREGIDNHVAWEQPDSTKGRKQVTGRPFTSLYRAARWPNPIRSIKQFQEDGNEVKMKGTKDEKNGSHLFVIELRLKGDSLTRDYYIDSKTYLIIKQRDHRSLHPTEIEKTIETRYEDYRKVNGVMVPFSSAEWDYATNTRLTQTQTREIIFNPNIEKTLFQLE